MECPIVEGLLEVLYLQLCWLVSDHVDFDYTPFVYISNLHYWYHYQLEKNKKQYHFDIMNLCMFLYNNHYYYWAFLYLYSLFPKVDWRILYIVFFLFIDKYHTHQ